MTEIKRDPNRFIKILSVIMAIVVILALATVIITSNVDATPPSKVTGLIATDLENGSIDLRWNPATDNLAVLKYCIYRNGTKLSTEPTTTNYVDMDLAVGATYTYQVSAVDTVGNEGEKSDAVEGIPTSDTTPPSQVIGLAIIDALNGNLILVWNEATDNIAVVKYYIYRDGVKIAERVDTLHLDIGLTIGQTYTYEVSALDNAGNEELKSEPVYAIPIGTSQPEPNINLGSGEPTEILGEWEVEVGAVSAAHNLSSYQVVVKNGSSIAISATDLDVVKASGASGGGLTLTFSDATNDEKLNGGDWFVLSGTDTISDYQILIYWKSTGNLVSGSTGMIEQ